MDLKRNGPFYFKINAIIKGVEIELPLSHRIINDDRVSAGMFIHYRKSIQKLEPGMKIKIHPRWIKRIIVNYLVEITGHRPTDNKHFPHCGIDFESRIEGCGCNDFRFRNSVKIKVSFWNPTHLKRKSYIEPILENRFLRESETADESENHNDDYLHSVLLALNIHATPRKINKKMEVAA